MYGSSFLKKFSASKVEHMDSLSSVLEPEPSVLDVTGRDEVCAPLAQDKPTAREVWREAVLPFLGIRLIMLIIGLLSVYYLLPVLVSNPRLPTFAGQGSFPQSLWLMWNRFDSGFYLNIASHGYWTASTLYNRSDWVFYPLYPLLIAGLGRIFGGSTDAFNIAGVLISNGAGVGMIIYFYLLVHKELGQKIAGRAILYLALFPLAFFLSAIYTESLLLCCSIAAIYYAREHRWWLAGLCGGLAALTRLQGVALVVPLAWEYLRVVSARYTPVRPLWSGTLSTQIQLRLRAYCSGLWQAAHRVHTWVCGLALALVPGGLLIFMLYGQFEIGDFFATFHASKWGWGRQLSSPLRLLIYSLRHPIVGQPLNWNFWLLNIAAAFAFLAVIFWSLRRLPMIYTLYTAVAVVLPLSSNSLNSLARYYLLVFPAFMLLALLTCKAEKQRLHTFLVAGFAALQSLLLACFVLGLFVIA
jgi:hypothetical protein